MFSEIIERGAVEFELMEKAGVMQSVIDCGNFTLNITIKPPKIMATINGTDFDLTAMYDIT